MNCPHCRRAISPSDFSRVPERDREAILRALTVRRGVRQPVSVEGPVGAFVLERDGTATFERHEPERHAAVRRRES